MSHRILYLFSNMIRHPEGARTLMPVFTLVLSIGLILAAAGVGQAALLSYKGTLTINFTFLPGDLNIGDTFDFAFTYDDTVPDTDISPTSGFFTDALTAFSMMRTGGTGSWNPSGTFLLPRRITTNGSTQLRLLVFGAGDFPSAGFPPPDGSGFINVDLNLTVPITDTGAGETLATQLNGPLPGNLGGFGRLDFSNFTGDPFASGALSNFAVVPAPSSLLLFGSGLATVACWRRSRTRTA